jgi:hypothetical protein
VDIKHFLEALIGAHSFDRVVGAGSANRVVPFSGGIRLPFVVRGETLKMRPAIINECGSGINHTKVLDCGCFVLAFADSMAANARNGGVPRD